MEFDLVSYVAGILATVIASITVALFIEWVQTKGVRERVRNSLFSEIEHNQKIVNGLLGAEASYLSQQWSYFPMPFSKSSFENAKQSGFLYDLRPEAYERISEAYDIIYLISEQKYGPTGTARNTFEELQEILQDIIKRYKSN